jgi:MFS family permease
MTDARIQRSLRLFYAFRLLATSYLYTPIFMLFQHGRGLTYFEMMALGALFSVVIILVEVPTGVFADRIGRRRSMLIGALTMVASCVVATCAHSFATFAVAQVLGGVSIALCSGADSAYLFDFLHVHERGHEYGRRESTASAWHLMGSAVAFAGGGLLARIDLALPYLVTAGVAAVAAVIACLLHDDTPAAEPRIPARLVLRSWGAQMRVALAEVGRNPRLAWLVGYSAVVFALVCASVYIYQPYLKDRGLGPAESGALFAGVYVIASLVASRTYLLRRRFGDETLLWSLLALLVVSFIGLAGAHAGGWVLSLLVVQAIANGLYSPLTKPLLNAEITDSRRRAAILSVESMARRAAMGLFALLVGLCGEANVMVLCALVAFVGLVLLASVRVRVAGKSMKPNPEFGD